MKLFNVSKIVSLALMVTIVLVQLSEAMEAGSPSASGSSQPNPSGSKRHFEATQLNAQINKVVQRQGLSNDQVILQIRQHLHPYLPVFNPTAYRPNHPRNIPDILRHFAKTAIQNTPLQNGPNVENPSSYGRLGFITYLKSLSPNYFLKQCFPDFAVDVIVENHNAWSVFASYILESCPENVDVLAPLLNQLVPPRSI